MAFLLRRLRRKAFRCGGQISIRFRSHLIALMLRSQPIWGPQAVRAVPELEYNRALDGLRGIAVLLVLADHCRVPGFNPGYFGVDLFFVLSGFLITQLLTVEIDATGTVNLIGFYIRRFLRLSPGLALLLLTYLLTAPFVWPQFTLGEHSRDAALAGLYLTDYAKALWGIPNVLVHTWSLSVEEHFYVLWPFAVLLLGRVSLRWRILVLVSLYLTATGWREYEYVRAGWDVVYFRFDTRISGLVCGALVALCLQYTGTVSEGAANKAGVLACAALAICLSIGFWGAPWSLTILTNLAHVAATGTLLALSVRSSWLRSLLSVPPLVGIGVVSYEIYLWHYPVAVYFREQSSWYVTFPIALTAAVALATATYWLVERPLRRYRRSFATRGAMCAAPPAGRLVASNL